MDSFWLSITESTPWLLWLSYGVLGGFGMGMSYTTTIATCQKWFPDKRGLATGIVSALGFVGLFTPVAEAFDKELYCFEYICYFWSFYLQLLV